MDSKIIKYFLLIFFVSFNASAIEFNGKFIQGHFIIGKTTPNAKILIDKKEIRVSKNGYFVFGIDRDRKYDLVIHVEKNGIKKKIIKISIIALLIRKICMVSGVLNGKSG